MEGIRRHWERVRARTVHTSAAGVMVVVGGGGGVFGIASRWVLLAARLLTVGFGVGLGGEREEETGVDGWLAGVAEGGG